jgi:hypothetical protein
MSAECIECTPECTKCTNIPAVEILQNTSKYFKILQNTSKYFEILLNTIYA